MQVHITSLRALIIRGIFGGILMGMANLVPGISGGTMLLAVGIYTMFIGAVADISTLKFSLPSLVTLATVVASAGLAILLGAGFIKGLVVNHRWIMYSLFIGLTLGGVPLVWRLAKPVGTSFWVGTASGFVVMVIMALGLGGNSGGGSTNYVLLFISGLAGAASMILPGISGGYILLLLGQYETILGSIDQVKNALKTGEFSLLLEAMQVVIPVGLGVLVGVIGVSNLIKWLLKAHEKPTLGTLFGLLLGAIVGLWPFQRGIQPQVGDLFRGKPLTAEAIASMKPEKWPLEFFQPSTMQIVTAILLVVLGLGITLGIEKMGRNKPSRTASEAA